jgi:hypothetical protein
MALTAQAAILSWGGQSAKETTATTFYRHKAADIDLGINDDTRLGQLEIGGKPNPTFPYKAGYMIGGGFTLQPRLEDTIGWLLYGALGKCTTGAADDNPSGESVKQHVFEQDTTDPSYVPWMSFRKYIPPKEGDLTTDLGEVYSDCKITSLSMEAGADTPLTSRVDVSGRTFTLADDANTWTYDNDYEDYESIPVGCSTGGFIKVDGVELPVVAARFQWQNQPLDPRQEKIIGDPRLEDITILTRQFSYDITVKFQDSALYRSVLTGSTIGTAWTSAPKTGSFDVKFVSSVAIPGVANYPYSLEVTGDKLMMQQDPIRLAAGQAIMARFRGVAIQGGSNYCSFTLKNLASGYTWPA